MKIANAGSIHSTAGLSLLGFFVVAACGSTGSSNGPMSSGGSYSGGSGAQASGSADGSNQSSSGTSGSGEVGESTGSAGSGADGGAGSGDATVDGATGDDAGSPGAPDGGSCSAAPKSTATQAGYVGDWAAGDYPSDLASGNYLSISGLSGQMGNTRQYGVHVPSGYRSDTPVPALFCIHGLGQTATMFCLDTGVAWSAKADQENFVVIMPNGYQNSWNAGTCCGAAASSGLDDVALIRAIFAEVSKHVNIDLRRVYATGLSNGGYLSYRLACEASDLFVAVAASAGAVGTAAIGGGTQATSDLQSCAPANKVSILDIHGTSDPLIPYSVQKPSLAIFDTSDGCSTSTGAAAVPASGGDTTCTTFSGCPSCPAVEVTACSVQGGGHCWFGSSDCGTGGGAIGTAIVGNNSNFLKNTDAVWSFLSRLSR